MHETLFGHLALRFATHPENLATEALGFLLGRSVAAREALVLLGRQLGTQVPPAVRFQTQAGGQDGARPDLLGEGDAGRVTMLVEVKFWAGLTDRQPVAYLNRLHDGGGLLLFVAPAARLLSLWPELVDRCRKAGLDVGATEEVGGTRSVRVGQHQLALVSWSSLLDAMDIQLARASDEQGREDLRQLRGLCARMDEEAFVPITGEELTSHTYRRVIEFGNMVEQIADLLVQRKIATQPRVSRDAGVGFTGRSLRLGSFAMLLLCDVRKWMAYAPTPLWLSIRGPGGAQPEMAKNALAPLGAREPPKLFMARDGFPIVPLYVPTGQEKDQVVEAIIEQIVEVAALLPQALAEPALVDVPPTADPTTQGDERLAPDNAACE